MSNNISSKVRNTEIFSLFPKYDGEQAFPIADTQKTDKTSDVISISPDKKTNKKKKILFGSTIASTILTAGILGLIFAKGIHGGSSKKLSKISKYLNEKIKSYEHVNTKTSKQKAVYYARTGTNKVVACLDATANFTAIKDSLCDKIFRINKFTTKFAENSTKFFKKIVDNTLGKKYDKVEVKVKDLTSVLKHYDITNINGLDEAQKLQEITIKGQTHTLAEWINLLGESTEKLQTLFDENFSLGARKLRDQKRSILLKDIPQKVRDRFFKNKKSLFNLKNYSTYVTEDVSKEAHTILSNDITSAKKKVTNNISSIHENLKKSFNSLTELIKPDDETSLSIIPLIKENIEKFKACSGANEVVERQVITDSLLASIDDIYNEIPCNLKYSAEEMLTIKNYLQKLKESVLASSQTSKGALEEIMTILKGLNSATLQNSTQKIISDDNYKELKKLSSKISKGLEKATDLESGEYFLKQAELKVGSAPTDVLSVLFPIGASAFAINRGENKDEKVSAVLTTCIPLVGTFATFVYGTIKMFSGAKNLIFSLSTGLVIGKLGSYLDKLYKKYNDTGSIVNVVKNEYDNLVSELTPQYAQSLLPEKKKDLKKK